MSAKRSKLVRKVALKHAPFTEDVAYVENKDHDIYDYVAYDEYPNIRSTPTRLSNTCYRKRVIDIKNSFKESKAKSGKIANKVIADTLINH